MNLFSCNRAMLDALGHHVHLPRAERDGAIAKLNVQHAFQHEKEIVRVIVLVPNKFADQCSANVDSFSDRSIPLLIDVS
jgi:hypothetical protein